MAKLLAKLQKSGLVRPGYLSPCALGWALGVLYGLHLLVYYWFVNRLGWEFLMYNNRSFGYLLACMPEWLLPTVNMSPLLPVFGLLYGMVLGGVLGLLIGVIYNWAQAKCGCKWCKV